MADIKLDPSKLVGALPDWDPSTAAPTTWNPLTWRLLSLHLITWPLAVAALLLLPTTLLLLRSRISRSTKSAQPRDPRQQAHLLIVLGSGGHTAELLSSLRTLNPHRYVYRTYLISSSDPFSAQKAHLFESSLRLLHFNESLPRPVTNAYGRVCRDPAKGDYVPEGLDSEYGLGYRILKVPRARKVHQSLFSTPISCVSSFLTSLRRLGPAPIPCPRTFAISLDERLADTETKLCAVPVSRGVQAEIAKLREESLSGKIPERGSWQVGVSHVHKIGIPDLVLTNGPATGLIVVLAAWWLRIFGGEGYKDKLRTIYVESFARVSGLSLSGRILDRLGCVDRFLVQWEKGLGEEGAEEISTDSRGGVVKRRGGREWRGFLVE